MKNRLWKLYLLAFIVGYLISLSRQFNIVDLVSGVIFGLGVFSYAFKKHIFPSWTWKILFWLTLAPFLTDLLYRLNYDAIQQEAMRQNLSINPPSGSNQELIINYLSYIPAFYTLFRLGFPNLAWRKPYTWWKIYFWFWVVVAVFSAIEVATASRTFKFADWINFLLTYIALLGLYVYIFGKKLFSANIWKAIFWAFIVYDFLFLFYYFVPEMRGSKYMSLLFQSGIKIPVSLAKAGVIVGILTVLPVLYALFKLGQKKSLERRSNV